MILLPPIPHRMTVARCVTWVKLDEFKFEDRMGGINNNDHREAAGCEEKAEGKAEGKERRKRGIVATLRRGLWRHTYDD